MCIPDESPFEPAAFSGVVRLFPVPNLVMFPHVMQPLHIFEARYRELVEDALLTDRLIATAQFEPGWEAEYDARPAIKPFGCLGKIVTHHRLPDGRFNLLLAGVSRLHLVEELPPVRLFRQARAELIDDIYPAKGAAHRVVLRRDLVQCFRQLLQHVSETREHLEPLLSAEVPLGTLTDVVAYTLALPFELKEQLLAERNVDARAEMLLDGIATCDAHEARPGASERFPPDFSEN